MSDERVRYSDKDSLISTTSPSSHITYCNEDFCQISGFREEELLDKPHNVIRHPDMPKAAFEQLWDYIQSGKSWMGMVKNKCKEQGNYYWVSAFVTPIRNAKGEVYEYQSIRTQPSDEQISRATSLYAKMRQNKASVKRFSWLTCTAGLIILQFIILLTGFLNLFPSALILGTSSLVMLLLTGTLFRLKSRLSKIQQQAKNHYDNPLMEQPYTGYCDDLSSVELALLMKKAELRAVTARAGETSEKLLISAEDERANRQVMAQKLDEQTTATEAMSVSTDQMLHSIDDVSNQAKQSSSFAQDAEQMAAVGINTIQETVKTTENLSHILNDSRKALEKLHTDVDGIQAILGLIQEVAEQTNLLALNAAIEAARAGEAGRGFAVVADEVRGLSEKTSNSVDEIRSKIEILQNTVQQATHHMQSGQETSENCVNMSYQSNEAFQAIVNDLKAISEQSTNTSHAIVEQVQVTQGISEHVHRMKHTISETQLLSDSSVERTDALVDQMESLQRLIKQFYTQTT
ncbi:methyl-accepting chemotaxis protein [Vibrio quintilis]|uniref:Aerotaxis receptor n=1 Tax=Vibrio quintilis TaxID=1117707 RepID=A0A1M7YXJ9_9VIBR|nr:PAS domain-containing methyl-accepting chemotaxis protein [Vibrio quintilis]SHO57409.1 Aerotaxis receptor [Vibrio quintilis]